MDRKFLDSYVKQIVKSCHNRGIHAMGGMSAFIPQKDPEVNKKIMDKVIDDKILEIEQGCDGAWVAHPGLIDPIKNLFDARIASHLYDAVNAEIKKLSNDSGVENFEDIVFGFMAQAEKDMNEAMLMPHDSVAGNLIQYLGFKPKEGSLNVFSPIHLMLISAPLLTLGSGFWKSVAETYSVKV